MMEIVGLLGVAAIVAFLVAMGAAITTIAGVLLGLLVLGGILTLLGVAIAMLIKLVVVIGSVCVLQLVFQKGLTLLGKSCGLTVVTEVSDKIALALSIIVTVWFFFIR